jgi:hypothetical protein
MPCPAYRRQADRQAPVRLTIYLKPRNKKTRPTLPKGWIKRVKTEKHSTINSSVLYFQ